MLDSDDTRTCTPVELIARTLRDLRNNLGALPALDAIELACNQIEAERRQLLGALRAVRSVAVDGLKLS